MIYIIAKVDTYSEDVEGPEHVVIPVTDWLTNKITFMHEGLMFLQKINSDIYCIEAFYYAAFFGSLRKGPEEVETRKRFPKITDFKYISTTTVRVTALGFTIVSSIKGSNIDVESRTISYELLKGG